MKKIFLLLTVLSGLFIFLFTDCNKNSGSNNSSNNTGNTSNSTYPSAKYKGALVGSTGYLTAFLQGNNSYINVFYVDSSKTPVMVIQDSLTTSGLANWYPGQGNALSNVVFKGSSGISVTLISVNADGSNPVVSISVPNDPYAKAYMLRDSVAASPLQVYSGKATPVSGISGTGGTCTCAVKTMNFVLNPAFVGSQYAAVTAIYIDKASHQAGFLNAQIASNAPNQIVSIINNNDTAGLHVINYGSGGPNSNNGSGYVNGSLTISTDGNTISGAVSGMYIPFSGSTSGSCACSYAISAKRVN